MSLRSEVITALIAVSGLTAATVFSSPTSGGESVVPTGTATPYVRMVNEFARAPVLAGDGGTMATRRQFQISLWQTFADEDDDLTEAVIAAIDGLKIAEDKFFKCLFEFSFRLEEREAGLAHHAMTFSVIQSI